MIESNCKVFILLATYNGVDFIREQLESIVNQSYKNWELIIRDDGSKDGTQKIIEEFCINDYRIIQIKDDLVNLGACQNFATLLNSILNKQFDFLMFADQDDFWFENKIEVSLKHMISSKGSINLPKLIYTDFEFADNKLEPLYLATSGIINKWKNPNLNRILAQNNIYGCTMMLNKVLVEKACPIPLCAENHDYWISLVAGSLGEIRHVSHKTMLYRQHGNNISGNYKDNSVKNRLLRYLKHNKKNLKLLIGRLNMARVLIERFELDLSIQKRMLIRSYGELMNRNRISRIYFCLINGVKKDRFIQNLAFYFNLFIS